MTVSNSIGITILPPLHSSFFPGRAFLGVRNRWDQGEGEAQERAQPQISDVPLEIASPEPKVVFPGFSTDQWRSPAARAVSDGRRGGLGIQIRQHHGPSSCVYLLVILPYSGTLYTCTVPPVQCTMYTIDASQVFCSVFPGWNCTVQYTSGVGL